MERGRKSRPARTALSRISAATCYWATAAVLNLATIGLRWPGALIGDSTVQLRDIHAGRLTDWHSPMMSLVWGALGASPQSMLILQSMIYWAGIALAADALGRRSSFKRGWWIFAVGLTPMSLLYLGTIQKDTLLVALLTLTFGAATRFGASSALIPGALSVLARANAVFAVPPLFVAGRRLWLTLLLCAGLSVILIPASRFVNRAILGAQDSHAIRSLQLFDLAGIEHHSGRTLLPDGMGRCYTVFYWDLLELECGAFTRINSDLTAPWLRAISTEPMAYAEHRLDYFNHTIFFLVPPLQECVYVPRYDPTCGPGGNSLAKDALLRNAFLWPVTWLAIGVWLLFMRTDPPVRMLAISGLAYGLGYLLVGVAVGFRYFYWTEFAVQLALAWQLATRGPGRWQIIAIVVGLIWVVGYAFRYLPLLV